MTRFRKRLEYLAGAYGPIVAQHIFRSLRWTGPDTGEKVLYITFDDGPTGNLTPSILSTLSRYSAKATFFFLGRQVHAFPQQALEVAAAGHTIGLHGYQHYDAWRVSASSAIDDFERGYETVAALLSKAPELYRPPYGRLTPALHRRAVQYGMDVVMWGVMPGDYLGHIDADCVAERVLRRAQAGSIVVLHDSMNPNVQRYTAPSLEIVLKRLLESGWTSERLTKLQVR